MHPHAHHQHHHGTPPPAPSEPGTIYTCPMHPEIRQDHPGHCPICGMTLEPLLPSLEANRRRLRRASEVR